jgi:hypothetical protein
MKRLHVIVGLVVVVAFLLTGQYMEFHDPKVRELDDGMRMMFRSRHIYILLAGLINPGVGAYFTIRVGRWSRGLQVAGSFLIIIAPFLLLTAFFREPNVAGLQGTFTLPGIFAVFLGTFFHLISGARKDRDPTKG